MDKQVSLYTTFNDNTGRPATYREIIFSQFAKDLPALVELRKLDRNATDYKIQAKPFKTGLQCFTPAALLASKAQGNVIEINRPGVMQLDFDYDSIKDYDLEEIKHCVFSLPFIGFCGTSCSGYGFYALALIAEPNRLDEYAEHCFEVFKADGIKADESKGKKSENLRFISYDANMLVRENPEPLHVNQFKTKQAPKVNQPYTFTPSHNGNSNATLNAGLKELQDVQSGSRWETVQRVAYSIGGLNNYSYLQDIINTINRNPAFIGEEIKYCKCAKDCFNAGINKPFNN